MGAPRVADFPEFWAFFLVVLSIFTISYDGNSMINSGCLSVTATAISLSDDTSAVPHQALRVRVHGDSQRLCCDELLQSLD